MMCVMEKLWYKQNKSLLKEGLVLFVFNIRVLDSY